MIFRDNAPYSEKFEDIYFNPDQGLAETNYVSIEANHLKERLQGQQRFVIGELGFGTGLNFLATLKLWHSLPEPKAELHYFSIEKYPLALEELKQAHILFPELDIPSRLLQEHYPPLWPGLHALTLIPNQVFLYLLIGDVQERLPQIEGPIDAWFLDGFAPKRNPEMWNQKVFHVLAKRSHSDTTLSTFSAAGFVRQNLEKSGFEVRKMKGFGVKKEMITARFTQSYKSPISAWFSKPIIATESKPVAIIGAGLAGLMTGYQLLEAGLSVEIFEQAEILPNRQCQNPAMLLRPYLSPNLNFFDQYFTQGFLGMRRFMKEKIPSAIIAETESECVIQPQILTQFLMQNLSIHLGVKADPFLLKHDFENVILTSGKWQNFGKPTPGQVSIIEENSLSLERPILTYQGYCIPDGTGNRVLGSSFRHDLSLEPREKEHFQNLAYLAKADPELADAFSTQAYTSFVGMRFTTKDHLPIIGGLPIENEWLQAYDRLRFGDKRPTYPPCPYRAGIYLNLAHGSKGLSSGYMGSKIIVSLLTGRPLPIGIKLWEALHPARFWLRTLKCAASTV